MFRNYNVKDKRWRGFKDVCILLRPEKVAGRFVGRVAATDFWGRIVRCRRDPFRRYPADKRLDQIIESVEHGLDSLVYWTKARPQQPSIGTSLARCQ